MKATDAPRETTQEGWGCQLGSRMEGDRATRKYIEIVPESKPNERTTTDQEQQKTTKTELGMLEQGWAFTCFLLLHTVASAVAALCQATYCITKCLRHLVSRPHATPDTAPSA